MLSTLSATNPRLQKLALQLNYPMQYLGCRDLPPASTEPVLSNTFPHLTDFSLKGLLESPPANALSNFLSSHPNIRSFTCHLSVQGLILPADIFPNLEYFEGSTVLLAAICETSESPRGKLIKVRVWESSGCEVAAGDIVQAFPKLPKLVDLHVGFAVSKKVTPDFLRVLGQSCSGLKTLSLRDPDWIGEQVSVTHCPHGVLAM